MLILSEGRASETWNLQVRQSSSGNRKHWKQKNFNFLPCLKRLTTLRSWQSIVAAYTQNNDSQGAAHGSKQNVWPVRRKSLA